MNAAAVKVEITNRFATRAEPSPHVVSLPVMLSVRTVAKRLKRRRAWVYSMCHSGVWGATRTGLRSWRIPEAQVMAWLAANQGA